LSGTGSKLGVILSNTSPDFKRQSKGRRGALEPLERVWNSSFTSVSAAGQETER
jgi:hypothetical protein